MPYYRYKGREKEVFMDLYGYVFNREGYYGQPVMLKEKEHLIQFIKEKFG